MFYSRTWETLKQVLSNFETAEIIHETCNCAQYNNVYMIVYMIFYLSFCAKYSLFDLLKVF